MASYTIRIELHEADWDDYVEMYQHLAAQGITDIISSDNGVSYKMPPAEYNYVGSATRAQVLEMAKASAGKVVRSYAVFVTESNGRKWYGLAEV
ncbi:hypothetical protein ACSMEB_20405 [Stenotrophomonas maltophilia]|uniref:hypothetical protein n=1 Tax=Stenotrophomonas maltophilia TaxID=40324 RepID=UPI000746A74B|nr:hypothetical protein [Stenotrophomonas maltophilia]KUJ05468.1 hypothetical protein AR275_32940 [Stenotrophomonas maltophilia]MBA0442508.1 hypothetical protein [Stenotrophomonas maltophilia]WNV14701.1 hypothetical protein RS400_21560 [Stenotrophomonas maltophilia]